MEHHETPIVVLLADDDDDDILLVTEAFKANFMVQELRIVHDGEELIDYLHHRGKYENPELSPRPDLILLDLNMPKKDGRQALKDIKSDANLRNIPVVVFTTSNKREDIVQCYGIGANSFMVKPVTFDGLVEAMKTLGDYWFEIVTLAHEKRYRGRSGSSVSDWGK